MNKKGLLLAGLAAYAYYKYKKMTPESKKKMGDTIKDQFSQHIPENLKKLFGSFTSQSAAPEYGKGTF